MRPGARIGSFVALAGVVVFVAGLAIGVSYAGRTNAQWSNELGWPPIATLGGAVLNCITVAMVAWAITTRLQERQSDKAFERGLLVEFVRSGLASAVRIHERAMECHRRGAFTEEDRQSFVLLFTALAQDILLIQDTLLALSKTEILAAGLAQECRSQYKDILTDRAPGELITEEVERAVHLKHREMRKHLMQIIIETGRN